MKSFFITMCIGISLAILGLLNLFDITNISSISFFGFSISALMFSTADLYDKSNYEVGKEFTVVGFSARLIAVFSLIVFPYIETKIDFSKFTNAFTLLAFGTFFATMSLDDIISWVSKIKTIKKK